jgi:hypothetical protein
MKPPSKTRTSHQTLLPLKPILLFSFFLLLHTHLSHQDILTALPCSPTPCSQRFDIPATWEPAQVPSPADTIIIDGSTQVNAELHVVVSVIILKDSAVLWFSNGSFNLTATDYINTSNCSQIHGAKNVFLGTTPTAPASLILGLFQIGGDIVVNSAAAFENFNAHNNIYVNNELQLDSPIISSSKIFLSTGSTLFLTGDDISCATIVSYGTVNINANIAVSVIQHLGSSSSTTVASNFEITTARVTISMGMLRMMPNSGAGSITLINGATLAIPHAGIVRIHKQLSMGMTETLKFNVILFLVLSLGLKILKFGIRIY